MYYILKHKREFYKENMNLLEELEEFLLKINKKWKRL
jgi:hypothetical protein